MRPAWDLGGRDLLTDNGGAHTVEEVVRSLATAAKTLRIYPPTSPIPKQAIDAALESIGLVLASQPTLPLIVSRGGFTSRGAAVNCSAGGELADLLTSHEVAQIDFLPGCTPAELAAFLGVIFADPAEVRAAGGTAAAMAVAGVENIVVSQVVLTTASLEMPGQEADIDQFLRELASDEQQLAAWLAAAASGDPAALGEGLAELARVAGPNGMARLEQILGSAFVGQDVRARDTIVGLALAGNGASQLLKGAFNSLTPHDLASSISDGMYAKNMLSMSNVLDTLKPGSGLDGIIAELRPMLAGQGHDDKELRFLEHMLQARSSGAEPALAERVPDFSAVATLARVEEARLTATRTEVGASKHDVNARAVGMMIALLDQQTDFDRWSHTLANLAALVPTLIVDGDVRLAERVFADLSGREARTTQPWPAISERLQQAMHSATSPDAMAALAHAVIADPATGDIAKSILRYVDPTGQQRFVMAVLGDRERNGMEIAERLLGLRVVDVLAASEPELQWFQVAQVVARLAPETGQRAQQALAALVRRPDPRARQEAARGLGASPSPNVLQLLDELSRDLAPEVAVAAVRSLGRTAAPGAAALLERIFEGLDSAGKDFPLAREVLGALSRTPDPGAGAILERIASHRVLVKRGHFAEVQELARQALAARSGGGGRP